MPEIRLVHTSGCAPENTEAAREVLRQALEEVGLSPDAYEEIEVTTEEESRRHGLVGGPAIMVDGIDVDPSVRDMRPGGLGCRAYITPSGVSPAPPGSMVLTALREALASEG